jgi:hypothetical protein
MLYALVKNNASNDQIFTKNGYACDYQYEKISVCNYAYNWVLVATTTCNSLYF